MMKDLVACKNISIKIGGMGMRLFGFDLASRDTPPSSSQLAQLWKPYVETVIEMFGAKRCMFESNFCVDKGTASYVNLWNAFKRLTQNFSPIEKSQLYSETAKRVYRLK
jgi:predicted TIM-barrel fold metal-dependent hydrolase